MKVSDIGEKLARCPFCGARPACPDWTCKRLAAVTVDNDGSYTVEFIDPHEDDEPEDAA